MDEKFRRISEEISTSAKKITVLPVDKSVKEEIFKVCGINPESLFGTLLQNTGGIVIDNWLRIYGAGELNFIERNKLLPFDEIAVAEDVLGGVFIYTSKSMLYFAPDCLDFEDTEMNFNQFFNWCLHGDTDLFYSDYRWDGWEKELADIGLDNGAAFFPFLWTKAESLESRQRKLIPMKEIIGLEFDFLKQLRNKNKFR